METRAIPQDFGLVIPGNLGFFEVLIVVSFILHIFFVNITVGSSLLAVLQEAKGIRKKDQLADLFAQQLANHTSIMKSIAVVLGVAPLLLISVIYTQYFYSSTNLIGKAWLSLIALLITAFLLLYAYKFTWKRLNSGVAKVFHLFIGAAGSLVLLCVPLIFIVNVVSMLHPEMWEGSKGFFHALTYYPQIWQRYFHFILATLAVSGMYLYFWNRRVYKKALDKQDEQQQLVAQRGTKLGAITVLWTTALQFLAGFLLLFSFKPEIKMLYMGEDLYLTGLLVLSLILSGLLFWWMYRVYQEHSTKQFVLASICFVLILFVMGTMRHELRENYLSPYLEENPRTTSSQIEKSTGR